MPAKGQTKTHCVRGHHKATVGTKSNGWCKECFRLSYERRGLTPKSAPDPKNIAFRSEYCSNGHHKPSVGVTNHYLCKQCLKERNDAAYWREWRRQKNIEKTGFPGDPGHIPNLKQVRESLGLNGKQMAHALGLSQNYYYLLEKGRKGAKRATMRKVLDRLSALLRERKPSPDELRRAGLL
jgi:DNA-binding XRE family transcriptional regulator